MPELEFQGEIYNDDRMFVLHISKCTVRAGLDGTTAITIHHQAAPAESQWCVVAYHNTRRYPPTRVDRFDTLAEAEAYVQRIEPTVPRVSLAGQFPGKPLPYAQWLAWKTESRFQEYDYRKVFPPDVASPSETLYYKA